MYTCFLWEMQCFGVVFQRKSPQVPQQCQAPPQRRAVPHSTQLPAALAGLRQQPTNTREQTRVSQQETPFIYLFLFFLRSTQGSEITIYGLTETA